MRKDVTIYNFEKGNAGERVARGILRDKGWMLASFEEGAAHPCDNIVSKWDMQFRALDIKTYPRRSFYPDTGINFDHYQKYMQLPNDFYLFFVDELEKKVYGNSLSELSKPISVNGLSYPYFDGVGDRKKVYFPLQCMELYATLSDSCCAKLQKLSNSNYKNNEPKKFDISWRKNVSWT